MSEILQIQLLGDFRLAYGDALLTMISSSRLKSLLAFLLLHRNSPQCRRYLAFLFWPDSAETQAYNNLRQSLLRLRQALPGAEKLLHSDAQTIQWLPDSPFTLNVAEFEKAVEHPDSMETLQYAANRYQGELSPDSQQALVWVADIAGDCQPARATEWRLDINSGDFVEGTKMFFPTPTP